jgi:hypothetical protein
MTHSAFRNLNSAFKYSEIRNPKSAFESEADELLAITVASINTARRKKNK